jgi:adenosine deaminase
MTKATLSLEQARRLPKIILHEHYDCSIRPEHVLATGTARGFNVPAEHKAAWLAAGTDRNAQNLAAAAYQRWLNEHARMSLTNYLQILWEQVLPTLQTQDDLYKTARERIEDAVADGMIFLKLRFAPQLHRREGLTLQQVIDPLQQAVSESPIPVRLVVCALRHENGRLGWHLANSVIRNPLVSTFDLAGDESKFPGVLPWWARQARRVRAAGKQISCHIGEAMPITDADHAALDEIGCEELGHGVQGDPRNKLCTVCMTSNLVTHIAESPEKHPIDRMYREGRNVSVDLDGTLLTGTTASHEYVLLNQTFGWGPQDFLRCNLNGLKFAPVDERVREELVARLKEAYGQEKF